MSNYVQTTFFTPKDTLPITNPAKTIFGAAYDVEFGNIATAIATKYDSSTTSITAANVTVSSTLTVTGTVTSPLTIGTTTTAGTLNAGNLLVQGDGTNGYLRATNGGILYLGTNSTNVVSITQAGNVIIASPTTNSATLLIGTTSVASVGAIEIENTTTSTIQGYIGGGDTITGQGVNDFVIVAASNLRLSANNGSATQLLIDTNGNVNVPNGYSSTTLLPVYAGIPATTKTANYTTVAADSNTAFYATTSAITITITGGASTHPVGTALSFFNRSGGNISIAISTDTLFFSPSGSTGTRTLAAYGQATAYHASSGVWFISGSGIT